MPSKDNPVDHAPRGLIDVSPGGKCSAWVNAPQFLWESELTWPVEKDIQMVREIDVEEKFSLKVNLV